MKPDVKLLTVARCWASLSWRGGVEAERRKREVKSDIRRDRDLKDIQLDTLTRYCCRRFVLFQLKNKFIKSPEFCTELLTHDLRPKRSIPPFFASRSTADFLMKRKCNKEHLWKWLGSGEWCGLAQRGQDSQCRCREWWRGDLIFVVLLRFWLGHYPENMVYLAGSRPPEHTHTHTSNPLAHTHSYRTDTLTLPNECQRHPLHARALARIRA